MYFSLDQTKAHSLGRSPFGGIRIKKPYTTQDLAAFIQLLRTKLQELRAPSISITLPPPYYPGFVTREELLDLEFTETVSEWNQFVELQNEISIHEMQQRKLRKSEQLRFQKEPSENLPEIHKFIAKCRLQQGLEINIDLPKLEKLWALFPDEYECYSIRKDGTLISAAIMVLVSDKICYYYLPATDQEYKSESPMVRLLSELYKTYQTLGYQIMDLGISSINGKKQEGLYDFKQRMGAYDTNRSTLTLKIG